MLIGQTAATTAVHEFRQLSYFLKTFSGGIQSTPSLNTIAMRYLFPGLLRFTLEMRKSKTSEISF